MLDPSSRHQESRHQEIDWKVKPPDGAELIQSGKFDFVQAGVVGLQIRARIEFEMLVSVGAVREPGDVESLLVVSENTLVVLDGCSTAWNKSDLPRRIFNGSGDGRVAVQVVADEIRRSSARPLEELIQLANARLRLELLGRDYQFANPGDLPGISGALAQFDRSNGKIDTLQWGDGIIVGRYRDGRLFAFPSQSYAEDMRERPRGAQILAECDGDRGLMWERFPRELRELRNQSVNKTDVSYGYGTLNGEQDFLKFPRAQSFNIAEMRWLFIGDDGLLPFEETRTPETIAAYVARYIEAGGVAKLLSAARHGEKSEVPGKHPFISNAEAVGLLLKFAD